MRKILYGLLIFGLISFGFSNDIKEKKYDASQAKPYVVVKLQPTSLPNYGRGQAHIFSKDAKTLDERVATIAKASKELADKNNLDYFQVFLLAMNKKDYFLYLGDSVYDRKGKGVSGKDSNPSSLKVSATSDGITDQQMKTIQVWQKYENDKRFEDPDFETVDEDKLISYLVKNKLATEKDIEDMPIYFEKESFLIQD